MDILFKRSALLTIYRSSIRPILDYGDIIYDKEFNESFQAQLEHLFNIFVDTNNEFACIITLIHF